MKVLHVISSPAAGGAEIYVKDLAKESVRQGHEVHVGFLGKAEDTGRSVDFENRFLAELETAGIKYFFIGHRARRHPWLGVFRVRRYVLENSIEIYHAHLMYGVLFGTMLDCPRIYTHHSVHMRHNRLFVKILGRAIDHLVGISDGCSDFLSVTFSRKVHTIFNGIDLRRISKTESATREIVKTVRCIAIGRICEQKNYELLVKAIATLPVDIKSKVAVDIAGEGPVADEKGIRQLITALNVDANITLLGNCDDIPSRLAGADLFLMTSAWEGLPIALLEATASGLPCIVTDVGGCAEVIAECQNGVVVNSFEPQSFAKAITDLLNDPPLFKQYSKNALSLSGVFSIVNAANKHLSLYGKALESHVV